MFHQHATPDIDAPPPSNRLDLARWLLGASPKLIYLMNFINECRKAGERVVVFCVWPIIQWLIEATCELLGLSYASIRSEKTLKQRAEALDRFKNTNSPCTALVASYQTAAWGLNVQQVAAKVVHMEDPYNMATIIQGNGRVHRLGQEKEQEFITLKLDASYDITSAARVARKFESELAGTLVIPEDAMINNELRPAGVELRAAFDVRYRAAVIADMLSQQQSFIEYTHVENAPTFDLRPLEEPNPGKSMLTTG